MRLKRECIVIIVAILICPEIILAQSYEIAAGLDYLEITQGLDGSWNAAAGLTDVLPATVSAMDAMRRLGRQGSVEYANAGLWVEAQELRTTDYLAERMIALSVGGDDEQMLLSYADRFMHAWGGYEDHEVNTFDTALVLEALRIVEHAEISTLNGALTYLLYVQNADGGWGFCEGDDSVAFITALVLKALVSYRDTFFLEAAINNGVGCLLTQQNVDGGFGSNPSTAYETGLAIEVLVESGADLSGVASDAIEYLVSTQLANGSWDDDPYSTALALRGLAKAKANLLLTAADITFSSPTPVEGESLTITATIHNGGPEAAENVVVEFFDGDPESGGVLIGEYVIDSLAGYGTALAEVVWTVPVASATRIFVRVDNQDSISELDEEDNVAGIPITSATRPDLKVGQGDITVEPSAPVPGESVQITAIVRNLGETVAQDVDVEIYDGDPGAGGVLMGSTTLPFVAPGGYGSVEMGASFYEGSHEIFVVADPDDTVTEGNEGNNQATKTVLVESPQEGLIDLTVSSGGIFFVPEYPVDGDTVEIYVFVMNAGTTEASNVSVGVYLGDPDAGGTQIGSDLTIPTISARGVELVSASWDSSGQAGGNSIFVKVDPMEFIAETDETNNKASKSINVAGTSGPDLMVDIPDISFTPEAPTTGDLVTIKARIRDIQFTAASNVRVEFRLADPSQGQTTVIGEDVIASISAGSYEDSTITLDTGGLTGEYEVTVNVDPLNEIIERSESNNSATVPLIIHAPQGPDLRIANIGLAGMITDPQTLQVSGTVELTIENAGNVATGTAFELTVFEDSDLDGGFDPAQDNILGQTLFSSALAEGASESVSVNLSGTVLFRDNVIHAFIDSADAVEEIDETNNTRWINSCSELSKVAGFSVQIEYHWTEEDLGTTDRRDGVITAPMVARIHDDDGNGTIDEDDVPYIIFPANASGYGGSGIIRAIRGDNGQELFSTPDEPDLQVGVLRSLAVADIDGDGIPEILGADDPTTMPRVLAFNNDGSLKWISSQFPPLSISDGGGLAVADLEGDGNPEIIFGKTVLNNDGSIKWTGTGAGAGLGYGGSFSIAADLDMDGYQEVVAGRTVYRYDGSIYWQSPLADGFTAVANFDDDPYPEIVLANLTGVYLLEHTGQVIWGPIDVSPLTSINSYYGPPAVADFDGDGSLEIAISGGITGAYSRSTLSLINGDGSIQWQAVTNENSGGTAATGFDFDGDGVMEIVYMDYSFMRIFRGSDGKILYSLPNRSRTLHDYPTVADVDNDGEAEIVLPSNWYETGQGIKVLGSKEGDWLGTRSIWNQHSYHITNVNDDGTIPAAEAFSWEGHNTYRVNLPTVGSASVPDITVSYVAVDEQAYPSSVTVMARIGNGGIASLNPGVDVSFYNGDPLAGGVLIGTVATTEMLQTGEYEDLEITWALPPTGTHEIHVLANEASVFDECRVDNNEAQATIMLGGGEEPPGDLPDLEVTPADLSVLALEFQEGQPAVISATVHNRGTLAASNVIVSFYDGNPVGGSLIGTMTIPLIQAGSEGLAQTVWDTFGQLGRNYIHAVVDEAGLIAELNEENNTTLTAVDISSPATPDLLVTASDLSLSDPSPQEGDPVTLDVTVHNLGTLASGIVVALYDGDPSASGTLLLLQTIYQIVPFGGQASLTFDLDTVGFAGIHDLYIEVDPDDLIQETSEANNTAWATLSVGDAGLALGVQADKGVYGTNEDVSIGVDVENLVSSARSGTLEVKILGQNGSVVATVASDDGFVLGPQEVRSLDFQWNTGLTFAGDYQARVAFLEAGRVIAQDSSAFSIISDLTLDSVVVTDKISYRANDSVTIKAVVVSEGINAILTNLQAAITVSNDQGVELYSAAPAISILIPGQRVERTVYWPTGQNPPGFYHVSLDVVDDGVILSQANNTFQILDTPVAGWTLSGDIVVNPNSVEVGESVSLEASATNTGNSDIATMTLRVLVVDPIFEGVLQTYEHAVSLAVGESSSHSDSYGTGALTDGFYLAILQADVSGETLGLTQAPFEVRAQEDADGDGMPDVWEIEYFGNLDQDGTGDFDNDGISDLDEYLSGTDPTSSNAPTTPVIQSPAAGQEVTSLQPTLVVEDSSDPDGDTIAYGFEVFSDAGMTNLVVEQWDVPEGNETTSWPVSVALADNTWFYWRVRATDGTGFSPWAYGSFFVNTQNDPPSPFNLSSPEEGSEVTTLLPVLEVTNSLDVDEDEVTYSFEVYSDADLQTLVTSGWEIPECPTGTTSWELDTELENNSWYFWLATATDEHGASTATQAFAFFVNTENDAPAVPVILTPMPGSESEQPDLTLTVENATDLDEDVLTYWFELDKVDTFDSAAKQSSGELPEGVDTTSWYVSGLEDNTWYYWRVKADDGMAVSLWAQGDVFINTFNDLPTTPTLKNPGQGAWVEDLLPKLELNPSEDIDGDAITYRFELYEGLSGTQLIHQAEVPGPEWVVPQELTDNSWYSWRAQAEDEHGATSEWMETAIFFVNDNGINDPPVADAGPDRSVSSDTQDEAVVYGEASDPDTEALTYRWVEGTTELVPWQAVGTGGEAYLVLGDAPDFSVGDHTLSLEVSDGQSTTSAYMILTVVPGAYFYSVLGTNSVWIRQEAIVWSGDIAALNASTGPWLSCASEVTIAQDAYIEDGVSIFGDTVTLKKGSSVMDVHYNELKEKGTIRGVQYSPLILPLDVTLPQFPTPAPGTVDYDLAKDETLVLDPGAYGEIRTKQNATVILTGGTYHFEDVYIGVDGRLIFQGTSEVIISNRFESRERAVIGPELGSGLTGRDIRIYVSGVNGNDGSMGAAPKVVEVGRNNTLQANIYAPNGTIWIRQGSVADGCYIGENVEIDIDVEVTLDTGF